MTQKIGALSVDLQAESAAFQRDMRQAQTAVSQATARMERDLGGLQRDLSRVDNAMSGLSGAAGKVGSALGALGVGVSALGLAQLVRTSLDAAGGLGELAEQAGVSADALQILIAAGAGLGVSAEQVQGALEQLTRRLGEAGNGNEQLAQTFIDLGISIRDSNGALRPTQDVFADIAQAISEIEDPAERARVAVELFGRAGQKLLPVLSQGRAGLSELEEAARRAGLVLSGETITAADNAGDKIAELVLRFERLQQTVAAGLSPKLLEGLQALERVFDRLLTVANNPSIENVLRLIAQGAGGALQNAPSLLPGGAGAQMIGRGLSSIGGPQTAAEQAAARVADLERRLAEARGSGRTGSVARLEAQLAEARQAAGAAAAVAPGGPEAPQTFAPTATRPGAPTIYSSPIGPMPPAARSGGGGAAPASQLAAFIQQLQQQAAAQQAETGAVQQGAAARATAVALIEAESRARTDAERGLRASADLTAAEREAITAAATARAEAADAETRANQARQDAARFTEAARTEEEKRAATIERLNQLLADGLITDETRARTIENLGQAAADAGREWQGFGGIATSAFEDAVLAGKSLQDVLRGPVQDISRLVLRNAVSAPLNSALSSLFSGIGGAAIPGRALGGPVNAGQIYEVGERGRELFVPEQDGRIIPNNELRDMQRGGGSRVSGGSAPVVVNFSFSGSAADFGANSRQIAGQLAAAVRRGAS